MRPRCPYCNRLLRPWTEKVHAPSAPNSVYAIQGWRYEGNLQVVARGYDTLLVHPDGRLRKWHDGMEQWASVEEYTGTRERRLAWVSTWDGKTYDAVRQTFCSNNCAAAFGEAAHRAGYRLGTRRAA